MFHQNFALLKNFPADVALEAVFLFLAAGVVSNVRRVGIVRKFVHLVCNGATTFDGGGRLCVDFGLRPML